MRRTGGYREVLVRCEHTERWLLYDNLKSGKSKGCKACMGKNATKYHDRLSWVLSRRGIAARNRCNDKNNKGYKRYGGRGIKFLFTSTEEYVTYCLTLPNAHIDLEVDRIDNDGNYEPGNLQWSDRRSQVLNRTITIWVEYAGERLCFAEFVVKHTDLSITRAHRMLSRGFSIEELVAYKPRAFGRRAQNIRSGKLPRGKPVCGSRDATTGGP